MQKCVTLRSQFLYRSTNFEEPPPGLSMPIEIASRTRGRGARFAKIEGATPKLCTETFPKNGAFRRAVHSPGTPPILPCPPTGAAKAGKSFEKGCVVTVFQALGRAPGGKKFWGCFLLRDTPANQFYHGSTPFGMLSLLVKFQVGRAYGTIVMGRAVRRLVFLRQKKNAFLHKKTGPRPRPTCNFFLQPFTIFAKSENFASNIKIILFVLSESGNHFQGARRPDAHKPDGETTTGRPTDAPNRVHDFGSILCQMLHRLGADLCCFCMAGAGFMEPMAAEFRPRKSVTFRRQILHPDGDIQPRGPSLSTLFAEAQRQKKGCAVTPQNGFVHSEFVKGL